VGFKTGQIAGLGTNALVLPPLTTP